MDYPYSEHELEEAFHNAIADPVQQALIRCTFSAYWTAFDECKHFPPEEARDLRGYYRWIQLRYEMRGLGDRFPSVTATAQDYHTLISAGRIRLIACSIREPGSPVRPATYKLKYANKSLDIFEPPPSSPASPDGDDYFFTVMVHGVDAREPRQPAFAKILFVTKAMQIWHEFNLFARHKDLVRSLWAPLSNTQEGMPDIRLRDTDEEQPQ